MRQNARPLLLETALEPGFARQVVSWQRQHGRQTLPWQHTRDPYRIWLSEIMLQQTQVATVIPYYTRFLQRFPTVTSLAAATESQVMELWAGLGYYTRARNLHRCAREVVTRWNGSFPKRAAELARLPGIGRSTAGAIAAFAFGERSPILDGNVRRVFARYFGIEGDPTSSAVQRVMWEQAERELPRPASDVFEPEIQHEVMRAYTQGLMDLGATVCTRMSPQCGQCPVQTTCVARRESRQDELPTPRRRRPLPERSTHLLWVVRGHDVLLQQRAGEGIWGGLLSLPEFDGEDAVVACEELGIEAQRVERLAPFVHTFTHFRLTMTPWWIEAGETLHESDTSLRWVATEHIPEVALPAPIRRLLTATLPLKFDVSSVDELP